MMVADETALYVVATPIGNLSDWSPRAIDTLNRCRLILAEDTRHSGKLLQAFHIDTPMLSYHRFNEAERAREMIDDMRRRPGGVALISDAGTPAISDPGRYVVRAAHDAAIPVYGVSGPSAVITALSVSGLPANRFVFYGFLPRKTKALRDVIAGFRSAPDAAHVFYESPHRVMVSLRAIALAWPTAQLSVSTELTKRHEKTLTGYVDEVVAMLEKDAYASKGEYTVVVFVDHTDEGSSFSDTGAGARDGSPCIEAQLVDIMMKDGVDDRQAASQLIAMGAASNSVYKARLRLKDAFRQ